MRLFLLAGLLFARFAMGQTCGALAVNPVTGLLDCIGAATTGGGTGTVTSVTCNAGLSQAGTATDPICSINRTTGAFKWTSVTPWSATASMPGARILDTLKDSNNAIWWCLNDTGNSWVQTAIGSSHTQNTDTGTTSDTFQIGSTASGPKLKRNGTDMQIRNAADTADVNLEVLSVTSPSGTPLEISGATEAQPTVTIPTLYFDTTDGVPKYLDTSSVLAAVMPKPLADPGADHLWMKYIGATGVQTRTRPSCGDLSDATSGCNGLSNLTNDAQTKASIVPNTVPSAGQMLIGNGAAYAPVAISGDLVMTSTGVATVKKVSQDLTLTGTLTPTALAGDANDYNPTNCATAMALRINSGGVDRNITGLACGTPADGRIIDLINISNTNNLVLINQSASSSAANRFLFPADTTLPPNTAITLRYDGPSAFWRPLARALSNSGVTPGTYTSVTVDIGGRVTAGTANPTSATAGGNATLVAPRQYYACTGACNITVPPPQPGYEFCVYNDNNVATQITFLGIGSGASYQNSGRTAYGTAGTGTLQSGGATGDMVCLVGRDTTHYSTLSSSGSWTIN